MFGYLYFAWSSQGLKTIYIPESLKTIDDCIIHNCLSILKIYCGASSKHSGGAYYNAYATNEKALVTFGVIREEYESTYKEESGISLKSKRL